MAAPITTVATTLEAQLLEVASALVALELAIPIDTRPDNVQITPDIDGLTLTVSAAMPATFTAGTGGKVELDAEAYLD